MSETLEQLVERAEMVMSHAWVVRAFVRHSDEAEDFVELGQIGRAIFDLSIALETRVDDPPAYFKMLEKKLGKFKQAVDQFSIDAPQASAHMNFVQAVRSIRGCAAELTELLNLSKQ